MATVKRHILFLPFILLAPLLGIFAHVAYSKTVKTPYLVEMLERPLLIAWQNVPLGLYEEFMELVRVDGYVDESDEPTDLFKYDVLVVAVNEFSEVLNSQALAYLNLPLGEIAETPNDRRAYSVTVSINGKSHDLVATVVNMTELNKIEAPCRAKYLKAMILDNDWTSPGAELAPFECGGMRIEFTDIYR